MIKADGTAVFNQATIRGAIYADSGTFKGRIEATEGYFSGNLNTPVLKASTDPVYSDYRTHSSGKSVLTVMDAEFTYWGKSRGNNSTSVDKMIDGTYGSVAINRIVIYDQGRPGGMINSSGITVYYTNGSNSGLIASGGTLPESLSYRYKTTSWSVSMANMLTEDPRIPGVLWRDGTDLKISLGGG